MILNFKDCSFESHLHQCDIHWQGINLYLQNKNFDLYHVSGKEEHQFVPDALLRLCVNNIPPPPTLADKGIVALRPVMDLPQDVYERLTAILNSLRVHIGLKLCMRRLLKTIRKQRVKDNLEPEDMIPDRMIYEFLRQCPYCQITNRLRLPIKAHRFTCASYSSGSHWTTNQRCPWK